MIPRRPLVVVCVWGSLLIRRRIKNPPVWFRQSDWVRSPLLFAFCQTLLATFSKTHFNFTWRNFAHFLNLDLCGLLRVLCWGFCDLFSKRSWHCLWRISSPTSCIPGGGVSFFPSGTLLSRPLIINNNNCQTLPFESAYHFAIHFLNYWNIEGQRRSLCAGFPGAPLPFNISIIQEMNRKMISRFEW